MSGRLLCYLFTIHYSLFTHCPHSEQLIERHTPLAQSAHASPGKGVAERSESFKIMIAGGNHTTVKSWQPERAD